MRTRIQKKREYHNSVATRSALAKRRPHLVSFNFAKVFDKVPHKPPIYKLFKYMFSIQVIRWIEEWLRNRVSVVEVNGLMSDKFDVPSSVLQGSIIGSLLFLLYINYMLDCISSPGCQWYADDNLLCFDTEEQDLRMFQRNIGNLTKWLERGVRYSMNPSAFTLRLEKAWFPLNISDFQQKFQHTQKCLRVSIQNDLKWGWHIVSIIAKVSKTSGLIRRALQSWP